MEEYQLLNDISAMYITASSFPEGVLAAHQQLHSLVPMSETPERKYFGISFPNQDGTIIYKAAAEELADGEAEKLGLETYLIKKGKYISIDIPDFMKDVSGIGNAFQELLTDPRIDHNGACVEWYIDADVKCMVRLAD
jgi:hypothetical protein